jgi:hypothetical protein
MRGDAVLGGPVHIRRADLNLERQPVAADDGCVERLVHIGLRRGDIILKTNGDGRIQVVDKPQHVIAIRHGLDDNAHGIEVVDFHNGFMLSKHFAVDAVYMLDTPVKRGVNARFAQARSDDIFYLAEKINMLCFFVGQFLHDLLIGHRVKVFQREVFEFPFDALYPQTVRQRGVQLHRLLRFFPPFLLAPVFAGAHIVQAVGDFDHHDADIARHGKEHLAQIFHLLFFFGGKIHLGQFCDPFDKVRDRRAEPALDIIV